MASALDKSVSKADDDTWTFQCPGVKGDGCGELGGPPFASSRWPTKKAALARGEQHFSEHKLSVQIMAAVGAATDQAVAKATVGVEDPEERTLLALEARGSVDRTKIAQAVAKKSEHSPMQELGEFRRDQGLVVNDDGSVSVEDL